MRRAVIRSEQGILDLGTFEPAPVELMYRMNGMSPRSTCGECRMLEAVADASGARLACRAYLGEGRPGWLRSYAACGLFQPVGAVVKASAGEGSE